MDQLIALNDPLINWLLQDELIEFFRLQMKCHHPQGVMTEDTGVYAVDIDIWKVLTILFQSYLYQIGIFWGIPSEMHADMLRQSFSALYFANLTNFLHKDCR